MQFWNEQTALNTTVLSDFFEDVRMREKIDLKDAWKPGVEWRSEGGGAAQQNNQTDKPGSLLWLEISSLG